MKERHETAALSRREILGAVTAASLFNSPAGALARRQAVGRAVMVGSANALAGMRVAWPLLQAGSDPLDAAIETVKVVEADPDDTSVGLGGLPNEDGVVQLDAAVMHGPTHNAGAVAALENILHPCEVARAVMERTDHVLLVGKGAYDYARALGHPHVELLTERARAIWLAWKEGLSTQDDRLAPPEKDVKHGGLTREEREGLAASMVPTRFERHGTVHCSVLSTRGEVACTTTTSGLAFKIPGRVGDSPIVGAGLYCDQDAGSAGSTGRGEASILSCASFLIVEELRRGRNALDAGMEIIRRIVKQVDRQAKWQPALLGADGKPAFGLNFYVLGLDGSHAGVTLKGEGKYAVADAKGEPRLEDLQPFLT
jgi:N4-(beta-N-acetylglucosaminyl)-L-asparaginase